MTRGDSIRNQSSMLSMFSLQELAYLISDAGCQDACESCVCYDTRHTQNTSCIDCAYSWLNQEMVESI